MAETSKEFSSVDEALAEVGGYRRWNILIFVLLSFSGYTAMAWNGLSIIFIGWTPPYKCDDWSEDNSSQSLGQCHHNGSNYENCSHWTYDAQGYTSIVTEWDLVCSESLLAELPQSILHSGALLGDIFGLHLLDRYGRKRVHILANFGIAIVGTAVAWMPVYWAFAALRLVEGFLMNVAGASGLVLQLELFDCKRREFPGIGSNLGWIGNYFLLCIMGYLILDWHLLQTVISLLSLLSIAYIWLTPDSPFWLEAKNKGKSAEKALLKIARMNGLNMKAVTLTKNKYEINKMEIYCPKEGLMPKDSKDKESCDDGPGPCDTLVKPNKTEAEVTEINVEVSDNTSSIVTLLSDPVLRVHTILSILLWLTNMMVYYFLALSSTSLAGNRFLNLFLGGLMEVPAYIVAYVVVAKIGRKLTLIIDLVLAGIPLIIIAFIPKTPETAMVVTGLSLTSRCLMAMSFAVMIAYTKELVPTNLRGTSVGLFNILGRIAMILVPFGAFMVRTPLYWVPNLVCGVVAIVVGCLLVVLPETTDKPLPQTIDDVYALYDDSQYTGLLKFVLFNPCRRKKVTAEENKC